VGELYPAHVRHLNLDFVETDESPFDKSARYRANSDSYQMALKNVKFPDTLRALNTELSSLVPGIDSVKCALRNYEEMIKEIAPENVGYSHAWREIYLDHAANPTKGPTVVLYLKCPKEMKVGVCQRRASDDTMTGAFLAPILSAYFSGTFVELTW
jgi:hypothetical protein